jgi:LysM repeat protein
MGDKSRSFSRTLGCTARTFGGDLVLRIGCIIRTSALGICMYTVSSNILSKSGLGLEQMNAVLAGHGVLSGLGGAFQTVENSQGVNAVFGMAQAALETGWGTSAIAVDKNNLFGITAYDSNPYGDASAYNTRDDCILYWGQFIKTAYLTPGGAYYVSATPAGVARHWATDPAYAAKIVSIMNSLQPSSSPVNQPVPAPTAVNKYVVQVGQNLSLIAQKLGFTLGQMETANPNAGHPAGNFNVLWPGDVLNIPGSMAVATPTPESKYYTVVAGDNSSVIAVDHGISLEQFKDLNPQISNFNLIYPGQVVRVG